METIQKLSWHKLRRVYFIIFAVISALLLTSCGGSKKASSAATGVLTEKEQRRFDYAFFNGQKAKAIENYPLAQQYFEECLRLNNRSAVVIYELARLYEQNKEYNKALVFAKQASTIAPENVWYLSLMAHLFELNGRYQEAATTYEELCKRDPHDLEKHFYWANALIFNNNLEKAAEVFDLIENQIGVDEDIVLKKQKIYMSLGDMDNAIKEAKKLIKNFPENGRYYSLLAEIYLKKGDKEKAMEVYQKQLEIYPDDPYIHLSLSEFYDKEGNKEKAHEELVKAFQNSELSIDSKVHISLSYFTLTGLKEGEEENMYELGKAMIKAHPNDAKAFSVYGDILYRLDSLNASRNAYRTAVEIDASKYVLWSQILLLDSELNDFKAMLEESEKALELFPAQPSFYLFKGIAANQIKQHEKAVEILNEGIGLVIDNPAMLGQFYSTLGDAYHAMDNHAASDSSFEESLKIDPENVYVLNNYSYYLSLRGENLERAKEMSKKTLEINPSSASFADTYAWILYKMGDYENAKVYIEKAMKNGAAENATILEHYGDVLYQLKDSEGALEYWNKAKMYKGGSSLLDQKIQEKKLIE